MVCIQYLHITRALSAEIEVAQFPNKTVLNMFILGCVPSSIPFCTVTCPALSMQLLIWKWSIWKVMDCTVRSVYTHTSIKGLLGVSCFQASIDQHHYMHWRNLLSHVLLSHVISILILWLKMKWAQITKWFKLMVGSGPARHHVQGRAWDWVRTPVTPW